MRGFNPIISAAAVLDSKVGTLLALVSKPIKSVKEVRSFTGGVIAIGVVVAILYFGRVFFITSLAAVTIAFILEPMVALLMRMRFPRSLASFVVCTLALLVVYLI